MFYFSQLLDTTVPLVIIWILLGNLPFFLLFNKLAVFLVCAEKLKMTKGKK